MLSIIRLADHISRRFSVMYEGIQGKDLGSGCETRKKNKFQEVRMM